MPTQIRQTCSPMLNEEVILSWTVHLARECPGKLVCSIMAIVFASLAAHFVIGGIAAIAVAIIMLISASDFLFPVKYIITKDGATCKMLLKSASIRWENVRNIYLDNYGIKLSPLAVQTRLEAFRGVFLRFSGNEAQVIDIVKSLRVNT